MDRSDDDEVGIPLVKAGGGRMRRRRVPEGGTVTVEINREAHSRRMKRYRVRVKMRAAGATEYEIDVALRKLGLAPENCDE